MSSRKELSSHRVETSKEAVVQALAKILRKNSLDNGELIKSALTKRKTQQNFSDEKMGYQLDDVSDFDYHDCHQIHRFGNINQL